jgi:hypothetical protein
MERPRVLRPLRERDFALLFTGITVSLVGDGIYLVAIAWQVYDISNVPTALSLSALRGRCRWCSSCSSGACWIASSAVGC